MGSETGYLYVDCWCTDIRVMVTDQELCKMSGVFAALMMKVAGWVSSGMRN